jgi:hypothetical protein
MKRLAVVLTILLSGCPAAGRSVVRPGGDLSGVRRVQIVLLSTESTVSTVSGGLGGASAFATNNVAMGSADQTRLALGRLETALLRAGLEPVNAPPADAVGEFTIGTIRYDMYIGWVADAARLTLRGPGGEILASFEAAGTAGMSSPEAVVDALELEIRKALGLVKPAPPPAPRRRGRL